jgi:hypothetical protein
MLSVRRTSALIAVAMGAALIVSGCSSASDDAATGTPKPASPRPAATLPAPDVDFDQGTGACATATRVGRAEVATLEPVAVVVCSQIYREFDGGLMQVVGTLEQRYDSGFDGLTTALSQPDDEPTTGVCTASLISAPAFVLVLADGSSVKARVPRGVCKQPKVPAVLAALVKRTPDSTARYETEHQPSDAAMVLRRRAAKDGCPETVELAKMNKPNGKWEPGQPMVGIRVCVMLPREGAGSPTFEYDHAVDLDGELSHAVRDAVKGSKPVLARCSERATQVAFITSADGYGGGDVIVEVDGCGRLTSNGFVGTASQELRDLLTANLA